MEQSSYDQMINILDIFAKRDCKMLLKRGFNFYNKCIGAGRSYFSHQISISGYTKLCLFRDK